MCEGEHTWVTTNNGSYNTGRLSCSSICYAHHQRVPDNTTILPSCVARHAVQHLLQSLKHQGPGKLGARLCGRTEFGQNYLQHLGLNNRGRKHGEVSVKNGKQGMPVITFCKSISHVFPYVQASPVLCRNGNAASPPDTSGRAADPHPHLLQDSKLNPKTSSQRGIRDREPAWNEVHQVMSRDTELRPVSLKSHPE